MRNEREESAVLFIGRLAGRLILSALGVLFIFIGARFAYQFGKDIFYQAPMEAEPGTDRTVTFTEDMTCQELAELLKKNGLITNEKAFAIQAKLYKTNVVEGEYTLNTSMTSKELLTSISETAQELEEAAKDTAEVQEVTGAGDEEGESNGKQ